MIINKVAAVVLVTSLAVAMTTTAQAAGKAVRPPPNDYNHTKYAPEPDILKIFHGFAVSFDSKDNDDGEPGSDLLRVPHWVAQELRKWAPPEDEREDDASWCLNTLKNRPGWFTDLNLFASGVAPKDESYKHSGYDRGHMAMKLLVERLDQDAAYNTHTLLNAIPQRPKFNRGIWLDLEYLTGAWAQNYDQIWIIQGPVFYDLKTLAWIGDEGERKVAVPEAVFKIVIRDKTEDEKGRARSRDKEAPEVLAFLYPQLGPGYFGPRDEFRHERFLTTIDEIEDMTDLDFKTHGNPSIEKRLERERATTLWDHSLKKLPQHQNFIQACRNRAKS